MGTWGAGNLESDVALDYLFLQIFAPLEEQILLVLTDRSASEADENADETAIAVDALAALCAHFHQAPRMTVQQLITVRTKFIPIWSRSMDGLDPVAGHKAARQAQIETAFDRLLEQCSEAI